MGQGRARGTVGPAPSARPRPSRITRADSPARDEAPRKRTRAVRLGSTRKRNSVRVDDSGIAVGDLGIILVGERSLGAAAAVFSAIQIFAFRNWLGIVITRMRGTPPMVASPTSGTGGEKEVSQMSLARWDSLRF